MFKIFLTTHKGEGNFNFFDNIIEIERYESRDKNDLENLLKLSPESLKEQWHRDALALYFHEVTHFLDLTTTSWGLEYILRKHLIAKAIRTNKKLDESLEVFMLNYSEIQMHSELMTAYEDRNLLDCTLAHAVKYNEKHRAFIEVYFLDGKSHIVTVPLSMLSVLESNAYASEILCKIRAIEGQKNGNVEVSLKILESEVNSYLNDKDFLEYSLLLILCKIHFKYLNLKEILIFFQVLVLRVLNMNTLNLSSISNFLKSSFNNIQDGNAICKDLQRGLSRHVVIFKIILLLHQFINEYSEKNSLIILMKDDPEKVIELLFKYYQINIIYEFDFGDLSEFYIYLRKILSMDNIFDKNIIHESSEINYKTRKEKGWIEANLSDFKLLDSMLSDGTIIRSPNRILLDIEHYFDNNIHEITRIKKSLENTDVSKFSVYSDNIVWA